MTNRFLLGVVESLSIRLNDLAVNLVCPAAVISKASGAHANVNFGHTERFTIVQGFNRREEFEVLFKQICQIHKVFSSLLIGDFTPCGLKGFAGNGDGVVDIFFGGFVDCADRFLGGGIDGLKSLAILSLDELVVDEAVRRRSACGLELLVGGEISADKVRGTCDGGKELSLPAARSTLEGGEGKRRGGEERRKYSQSSRLLILAC